MPKTKQKINPETGKRLKKLLKEAKLTQKQLHRKIKISQQRISDIITGRCALTENVASKICDLKNFKNYDLLKEWLYCEEDFKSNTEKLLNALAVAEYEGNKLLQGLGCFLLLANYNIVVSYPEELSFDNAESIKNIVPDSFPTYTIRKGDQLVAELSQEEMISLGNKLFRLFEVYIKDYFD